jgi:hypothetical protein
VILVKIRARKIDYAKTASTEALYTAITEDFGFEINGITFVPSFLEFISPEHQARAPSQSTDQSTPASSSEHRDRAHQRSR